MFSLTVSIISMIDEEDRLIITEFSQKRTRHALQLLDDLVYEYGLPDPGRDRNP